jgi:hypothetical protein
VAVVQYTFTYKIITFRNIHCVQRACKYKLTLQIACVIMAFQQYSYRNCFPQQNFTGHETSYHVLRVLRVHVIQNTAEGYIISIIPY